MEWTVQEFGERAALRYDALINKPLRTLALTPNVRDRKRPEIMVRGARICHLEFSRNRVSGSKVKAPRHFLLYRRRDDGVIEVARILHDGRDLQRHLPEDYRPLDAQS
jgi:toxin ParE1/3/4